MNNCLITKLKTIVNNDSLEEFDTLHCKLKDTQNSAKTFQIYIKSPIVIYKDIHTISGDNLLKDGETVQYINENIGDNINTNSVMYEEGQIPANYFLKIKHCKNIIKFNCPFLVFETNKQLNLLWQVTSIRCLYTNDIMDFYKFIYLDELDVAYSNNAKNAYGLINNFLQKTVEYGRDIINHPFLKIICSNQLQYINNDNETIHLEPNGILNIHFKTNGYEIWNDTNDVILFDSYIH